MADDENDENIQETLEQFDLQLSSEDLQIVNDQVKQIYKFGKSILPPGEYKIFSNILKKLEKVDKQTGAEGIDPGNKSDFKDIMKCVKLLKDYSNQPELVSNLIRFAQEDSRITVANRIQTVATNGQIPDPDNPSVRRRLRPAAQQQQRRRPTLGAFREQANATSTGNEANAPGTEDETGDNSPKSVQTYSDTSTDENEHVTILKNVEYNNSPQDTLEFFKKMEYKAPYLDAYTKNDRVGDFYRAEFKNVCRQAMSEEIETEESKVKTWEESFKTIPFCGISVKTATLIYQCLDWMKNNCSDRSDDEKPFQADTTLVLDSLMDILLMSPVSKGDLMKFKTRYELQVFHDTLEQKFNTTFLHTQEKEAQATQPVSASAGNGATFSPVTPPLPDSDGGSTQTTQIVTPQETEQVVQDMQEFIETSRGEGDYQESAAKESDDDDNSSTDVENALPG